MKYEGLIVRPAAESASLLLQVTVGSRDRDSIWYPIYSEKEFRARELDQIRTDIDESVRFRLKRVFLCDADVLTLPLKHLEDTIAYMKQMTPWVEFLAAYADHQTLLGRSVEEWRRLRDLGLQLVYAGIESGRSETRKLLGKDYSDDTAVAARARVAEAGIGYCSMVMLGLGGQEHSEEHARKTAQLVTRMQPEQIDITSARAEDGGPVLGMMDEGLLEPLPHQALLRELMVLIRGLEMKQSMLMCLHSSNPIQLRVALPGDRNNAVEYLSKLLKDKKNKK